LGGQSCAHQEASASSLGDPRITVEQYQKIIIFFGNAAGALGNQSYYLMFNNFSNSSIQIVFSAMYLCIYIATHQHMVYRDWQQVVL
jgi:hypothetical protein